jgi:hypothetical protein
LGFTFLGLSRRPTWDFPSKVLLSCALQIDLIVLQIQPTCRHFRVSIGQPLEAMSAEAVIASTLLRFVHRSVPVHLGINTPGYGFTSPGFSITALDTDSLVCLRLTGVARTRLWC